MCYVIMFGHKFSKVGNAANFQTTVTIEFNIFVLHRKVTTLNIFDIAMVTLPQI